MIYRIEVVSTKRNGEIDVPEGYTYVMSETFDGRNYNFIRYNFVNTVDVEAEEYVDENGNTAYPIAGTPLDLEKAAEEPKVLVK